MKIHHELVEHQLHVAAHAVADNAARVALEATLVAADRGYLVLQLDDGTVWQCVAAGTLVFVGNNLSGEGYSVDSSGTVTIKLGDAAGAESFILTDSGDATVFEIDSNGVITTYAAMTFGADIILDDGAGDSPNIRWVGGSNDDTAYMFLDDDAVAGDSDLVIKLVDAAGDSVLKVLDSGDATIFSLDSNGNIVLVDGATVGQAAGPLLTFDDTLNFLEITGCDVGLGTATPTANLDVEQAIVATGIRKGIVYTGAINTNQTLSTEIPAVTITTAGREWATGALALQREVLITQPTYTFVGASTITDAATVGIVGAPIESTNATITNTHGLLIQAGAVGAADVSYGLTVNAQTGAGVNYAAVLLGGNVGVGVTDPDELLELYKVGTQLKLSGGAADYATFAVAADGALTITTVDVDAAEADIILAPDGDVTLSPALKVTGDVYLTSGLRIGDITTDPDDNTIEMEERSTDPGDPAEGNGILWLSDGSDIGEDGDLIWKRTAGGVTRSIILGGEPFYGVMWNESTDAYERTGTLTSIAVGSSPGNGLLSLQSMMRRCVMDDTGVIKYYLCATDSTKKEDCLTASVLDGTDGQVMVEIPKFYLRYSYAANLHRWDISPVPLAGFSVHPAFFKNGAEVDARYMSAYEGILYDDSESVYTSDYNPIAAHAVTVDVDVGGSGKGSITENAAGGTIYAQLQAGDVIVVTGTADNNGTYIVESITGGDVITCTGVIAGGDGVEATCVISAPAVDTANDILSSVSGKKPFSGITRDNFRSIAALRGTGWRQFDFYLASAIQLLYLTEYASFYSQSMIGAGLTDWVAATWNTYNAYHAINNTGLSNGDGNATANVSGGDGVLGSYMTYRGIENWYGHLWKFVDGFNINNNVPYVCNTDTDFADDTATDYTDLGITLHNANGWQNTLEQISGGFLPASVGASSSTKITDYYYQDAGWRVALLGGTAHAGAYAGGFYWTLAYSAASLDARIGARPCY